MKEQDCALMERLRKEYMGNYDANTEVGYSRAIDWTFGYGSAHAILSERLEKYRMALEVIKFETVAQKSRFLARQALKENELTETTKEANNG